MLRLDKNKNGTIIGQAHVFGEHINTDYIIAGKHRYLELDKMITHIFEDIRPGFYKDIKQGDIIVAGKNFGCGSSREYAPRVLLEAGIRAVVAESFARIFYRNAINSGLLPIVCDVDFIQEGDQIEVDLDQGILKNISKNSSVTFKPIPAFIKNLIEDKGLIQHIKQNNGFALGE